MRQHKEYREVLGKEVPKDFAKFREMKYNNPERWRKIYITYKDEKQRIMLRSDKINKTVHIGKQGKHILGHNNYTDGRSYLTISVDEIKRLVEQYAGTGRIIRDVNGRFTNKEKVTSDRYIGIYKMLDGTEIQTKSFIIHYSKSGVHIVPSKGE